MTIVERPAALSDQLVMVLEQRINQGEFPPGARLPSERELCSEFGVSRVVVREAIARLKSDGYVETRQGAGALIPAQPGRLSYRLSGRNLLGREDLRHVMELRFAVEVLAAELAAKRHRASDIKAMHRALTVMDFCVREGTDGSEADDRFHQAIAAATRNPHLERFVDFLRFQFGATRRVTWSAEAHRRREARDAQREHERLFAAIRGGDANGAGKVAKKHLSSSAARLGLQEIEPVSARRVGADGARIHDKSK
jgi:GntR family transcriptional repressor for pyruvate dehydrogenase complex